MLSSEEVQALIRFVAGERRGGSDLSVEVRTDGLYLRIGGDRGVRTAQAGDGGAAGSATAAPAEKDAPEAEEPEPAGHVLTAPIVGTFYAAPNPESAPYVEVGSQVEKGQVVCIVEAMKVMNEIETDVSGVVASVVPGNGDPVEFGAPLFVIRT